MSTTGGSAGTGQIWELDAEASRLRLLYESPGSGVLDQPNIVTKLDNGALLLCEDGGKPTRLAMLTPSGSLGVLAENNVVMEGRNGFVGDFRDAEWCGVWRAGDWVFANIQIPGITFAITGPWDDFMKRSS